MSVRKLKPITPGQRFRVVNGYDAITTDKPEKSLLAPKKRSGGRNSQGKMTMRYIGGGHKKRYRIIDFKRDKSGIPATVKTIEYDPNRTAFIALLSYALYYYPTYEELLHGTVFPLFIYGVVFLLWVFWVLKFSAYAKEK